MLKIKTCIGDKEKQWIYTWPLKDINKNHEVIQSYTTHVRQFISMYGKLKLREVIVHWYWKKYKQLGFFCKD
jgi:hypothetical protein